MPLSTCQTGPMIMVFNLIHANASSLVLQWRGGGFVSVRRMRGEGDWSWSSVSNCCLLTTGTASSLPAIPCWPGIQSRVVMQTRFLSMRLRSAVTADSLRIALRNDCLSVQVAAAACNGKSKGGDSQWGVFHSRKNGWRTISWMHESRG